MKNQLELFSEGHTGKSDRIKQCIIDQVLERNESIVCTVKHSKKMFAFQAVQQKVCSCKGFPHLFLFSLLDGDCNSELVGTPKTTLRAVTLFSALRGVCVHIYIYTHTHIYIDAQAWKQLRF